MMLLGTGLGEDVYSGMKMSAQTPGASSRSPAIRSSAVTNRGARLARRCGWQV